MMLMKMSNVQLKMPNDRWGAIYKGPVGCVVGRWVWHLAAHCFKIRMSPLIKPKRQQVNRREVAMQVIVDLCLVPIGVGVSLSAYVAACEKVLAQSGLAYELHANGTNIEGEWDAVFAAVRQCHESVHRMGAPRIFTTLKIGTRTDKSQRMADKVRSVEDKL
jgi:uncharacterized protein (TIGR00106 family)